MNKEQEIGEIQLWNEIIEDLKEQAGYAKALKDRIRLAKSLNDARGCLKYAESKILALVLLAILFCSQGCQTIKGVTGDAGWILTELSDNIQTEGK